MNEGAVLCLPIPARGQDTLASADFGKCIVRNIDFWFSWTQRLGLVVERMEDIILVTGSHLARSWTNVVFPGDQEDAQASFGAKVDQYGLSIHWEFLHEQNRGVVLNFGPAGEV